VDGVGDLTEGPEDVVLSFQEPPGDVVRCDPGPIRDFERVVVDTEQQPAQLLGLIVDPIRP
jgi:hypothetical protein